MHRRYLAIGLLVVGCGAETPRDPIASSKSAVVGAQIAVEYEQAPAYFGTVAFGANGSYLYRKIYGPYTCDRATFGGDPAFGVIKACYAADPIIPPPRAVNFLYNYPSTGTFWSDDVQGLAHSADSWLITQKSTIWKVPFTADLGSGNAPAGSTSLAIGDPTHWVNQIGNQMYNYDLAGYNHFGDGDVHIYHQGGASALFVPLQGAQPPLIAVFDADYLAYVTSGPLPDVPGIDFSQSGSWVAARPGAGPRDTVTLWVEGVRTSDQHLVFVSFQFDSTHLVVKADGTWVVPLGEPLQKPIPPSAIFSSPTVYLVLDEQDQFPAPDMYTMQGGDFNEDGSLLYTSNGYCDPPGGKVHVFRILDQYQWAGLRDESYNPDDSSAQLGANRSFQFQAQAKDKICPSTVAWYSAVFAVLGFDEVALVGLAAGEHELDGNCKCTLGAEEPEGVDYFDTRGMSQPPPGFPDSQVHIILGDNGVNNVWLKHYALDTDLALNGTAWQSSNFNASTTANLGNDGNMDGQFGDGSVMHTGLGLTGTGGPSWPGQYWAVDLGATYTVDDVILYNRTDCCAQRLEHYNVLAYDPPNSLPGDGGWAIAANHSNDTSLITTSLDIPMQISTRYIMIAKTDGDYLHMAEVQVMGH